MSIMEIGLVQEIEKHACLYNSNSPDYNRKDPTEQAWAQVAKTAELTVSECKDKWRNIRNSLLRSLKPSEKNKKPYYLLPWLHFVLPYLRSHSCIINTSENYDANLSNVQRDGRDGDVVICSVKSEEEVPVFDAIYADTSDDDPLVTPLVNQSPRPGRKKKWIETTTASSKKRKTDPGENNNQFEEQNSSSVLDPCSNSDSMRYFLMSLLPEFETMTEEQLRLFKIKVMILVDDIKSNFDKAKANTPSTSDTERLQKRLVNLLLKIIKDKS